MDSDRVKPGNGSSSQLSATAPGAGAAPAAPSAPASDDGCALAGEVIDNRYRIMSKLGEGGMGEVYAAEHIHIQKRVAVKLLRREVTSNPEAVTRFQQEARSASQIGHQNIIAIEDAGTLADGRFYLCMELLDGQPLNDILEREALAPDRALDILVKACHGLAAAHKKGIVHRDMKPENIFITTGPDGKDVPKLLDFGIAKVSGADGDNNLTRTGTIFGTPFYMAPEQALGQGIDQRADVYAIGVIMYEVFAGSVPFQGESFMGILTKHITAEPESPAQRALKHGRTLPPGVEPIIARALKKEPSERFQSMDELVTALIALHRRLVGPGVSGYMAAHIPAGSAVMPVAQYPGDPSGLPSGPPGLFPGREGTPSGPFPAVAGDASGMASGPYSGGYQVSPSASSSMLDMPGKGSKAGLIAAIIIVLAVVGGTVGFLFLPGGEGTPAPDPYKSASNQPSSDRPDVAANPVGGEDTATPDPQGAIASNGPGGPGGPGGGNGADPAGSQSDGAGGTNGPDQGDPAVAEPENPAVVTPPEARPVVVVIASRPKKAVVKQDGVVLGTTPLKVKVIEGRPVSYSVSKNRYRDEDITLDGSETRVTVELDRRPRVSGPDSGGGSSGNGSQGSDPGNGQNPTPGKDSQDPKNGDKDKGTGTLKIPLE